MTAFEGSMLVVYGAAVMILFLTLSSLSQFLSRYVAAYERVVDAAVSPREKGSPVGETLEAGVYHATPQDIHEYMLNRDKQNRLANTIPHNPYDDEYEGFPIGRYSEERRL